MKKLITLMLVLLIVGGAVFGEPTYTDQSLGASTAASIPTNAVLNIQANSVNQFVHGFSMTDKTTYGGIISNTMETGVYKTILFSETNNAQPIGYYQIATNSRNKFSVTLTATTLKSEKYIGSTGTYMHVPYTLKVEGYDDVSVETDVNTTGGSGTLQLYAMGFQSGNTNGVLFSSNALSVLFDAAKIKDSTGTVILPEGNYVGTITVAVTGN
ncbi:MAG: hypothetical protein GX587_10955 [Bacteroidales bacterium]|nr:hypothetical protein [Bacteroidales bacterium]